ncbi:hypothetical protein D3C79_664350 [compost metagenome]
MEQESTKLDRPEPISDNIDRDWLLQHLVTHANRTQDFSIPITLWVGGGLISGVLVSGSKFFDAYTEEIVKVVNDEGKDATRKFFRELGGVYYEPTDSPAHNTAFIHLLEAKLWSPSGQLPSASNEGVAWRGRLSQVTGYSLGRLMAKE